MNELKIFADMRTEKAYSCNNWMVTVKDNSSAGIVMNYENSP